MRDDQYILVDNLVTHGYGEDKRVRPLIDSDDDNLYDYYDDIRKSQKEKIFLTSERKQEISESIDSLAKEYKLLEHDDDNMRYDIVMIPLFRILAIANNATERIFALNYARDSGYQIRGKDISLVDKFDNYHLIPNRYSMSIPQPYSKTVQKKLIEKYFRYKRIEKVLEKLRLSESSLEDLEKSDDYNSLDFHQLGKIDDIESVLEDLQEDCIRIRNRLVEHNLRLVYKYFQDNPKLWGLKEQAKDNISTAYMLTINGVDAYLKKEENVQWEISTFIFNHLGSFGERTKKTFNNDSFMYISNNYLELLNNYRRVKRDLEETETTTTREEYERGMKPNIEASKEEIAEILGCSVETVERLEMMDDQIRNLESYDELQEREMEEAYESGWIDGVALDYDEPNYTDLYHLADENSLEDDVINNIFKNENREILWKIMNTYLTDRDKDIIVDRFGLNGKEPKTLEEIGRKNGIHSERVRQVEARALGILMQKFPRKRNNGSRVI